MLYGAFLDAASRMRGDDGTHARTLFKRRGARAFATEAEHAAEAALEARRQITRDEDNYMLHEA